MLGSYVCSQSLLGADFGQSAVKCTGNKVDEKAWSIIDIGTYSSQEGREASALHSLLVIFIRVSTGSSWAMNILLLPWNYLVLKQGSFCLSGALDHLRNDCKSRALLGKKGVSMSSLSEQSRGRTGRQPSCSEARKSTILGYRWKWSGSPYPTTSAGLCPSGILVRLNTEHKKNYAKTRFQATWICTGELFCWHN